MDIHETVGLTILTLTLWRVLWGFFGSHHSRFSNFVRGPSAIKTYLQGKGSDKSEPAQFGHNPLGALSVLAMLVLLIIQAVTGMFSSDDIMFDGPLVPLAGDWSGAFGEWHEINWTLLLIVIGLHLLAIVFYQKVKGQALIQTMLFGRWDARYAKVKPRSFWLALLLVGLVVGGMFGLATLIPEPEISYFGY